MRKSIIVFIVITVVIAAVIVIDVTVIPTLESEYCEGWFCLLELGIFFSILLSPLGIGLVLIGATSFLYAKIRKKVLRRRFVYIFGTLIILGFLILIAAFSPLGFLKIMGIFDDRQQREDLQKIAFQLYKPTYLPSGYPILNFSISDYQYFDPQTYNPEDKIFTTRIQPKDEDRSSLASEWGEMNQMKLNGPFPANPAKCPGYGLYTQEMFNLECVLVTTTPKGHRIYKSKADYDTGVFSLVIDNTLFIFNKFSVDLVELTKVVDSLVPLNPTDVEFTGIGF